jgi:hypothetical protein
VSIAHGWHFGSSSGAMLVKIEKLLAQGVAGFRPSPDALDSTLKRFRQRQRRKRVQAAAMAVALSVGTMTSAWIGLSGLDEQHPSEPQRMIEARLAALGDEISDLTEARRVTREELAASRAVAQRMQELLATLRERREGAPAAEQQRLLRRIERAKASLGARREEARQLAAKVGELATALAAARAERDLLRELLTEWLAAIEDHPA